MRHFKDYADFEEEIIFNNNINDLTDEQKHILNPFLYN